MEINCHRQYDSSWLPSSNACFPAHNVSAPWKRHPPCLILGYSPIARRQYQRQGALPSMKDLPVAAILRLQLEIGDWCDGS
jgi:hypothetical protein